MRGQGDADVGWASFGQHVGCAAVGERDRVHDRETTPLEPGVLDHKMYVRGIGTVLEARIKGGDERLELVSFNRG